MKLIVNLGTNVKCLNLRVQRETFCKIDSLIIKYFKLKSSICNLAEIHNFKLQLTLN